MSEKRLQPEVIVFAGPNGSGKSTLVKNYELIHTIKKYINVDDIKRVSYCTDLQAAKRAEKLRESAVNKTEDFAFETVLSTDRNLKLLQKAKEKGYFVRGFLS